MRLKIFVRNKKRLFTLVSSVHSAGPSQGPKIRGGGLVVLGGNNVPPLVEIGLTDLPKTGGAKAPQLATALIMYVCI